VNLQLFGPHSEEGADRAMGGPDPSKFRMLSPGRPENGGELRRCWPFGQFPLLVGGDRSGTSAEWVVSFQGQPSAS
jgi:hypothetical protein